jgi:hypothetical protein
MTTFIRLCERYRRAPCLQLSPPSPAEYATPLTLAASDSGTNPTLDPGVRALTAIARVSIRQQLDG